jgi:hypothetical protein
MEVSYNIHPTQFPERVWTTPWFHQQGYLHDHCLKHVLHMPVVGCWILCILCTQHILFLMFHLFAHYTICHNSGISVYICCLHNILCLWRYEFVWISNILTLANINGTVWHLLHQYCHNFALYVHYHINSTFSFRNVVTPW